MTIVGINLKVKDVIISEVMTERGINGRTQVEGNCKVSTEEDDFIMKFTYRGKSNESSSNLYSYLYELAEYEYCKRRSKIKEETLLEFANKKLITKA